MLVVWGHTVVVLGFFFSTFFNRPRAATFVGYLIVVASVVVASLLETLQVTVMWLLYLITRTSNNYVYVPEAFC